MTLYEELRQMDPTARSQAYQALTPEQKAQVHTESKAASKAQNEAAAASAEAPSAADAGARGTLQGLTFGMSEEIGSLSRMLPGGESPQEYRDRKRAEMDRMMTEQPGAYLGGEIAGAVAGSAVPLAGWITGPARAARVASIAPRIAASMGRGAIVGGADAAAQAAGRAEGGMERAVPALQAIPAGMAFGAAAGPLGELLQPALSAVARQFGRTASVAVEKNVREIADRTGMSTDEVLRRIGAGQPLAGMNDTTRMAARAIKNLSPAAGQQMIEATGPRLERAVGSAVSDVQTSLAGPGVASVPNLRATVEPALNEGRDLAGEALRAARGAAGDVQSGETIDALLDAVTRTPKLADELNTTLRIKGSANPLFKKTPQGVQMLRLPTVTEAEIITRELQNRATTAYSGTGGLMSTTRGEAFEGMGKAVREGVDAEAPQLGPLRADYEARTIAQKEAYPLGQLARSTAPDKFAMEYGPLADIGKDAARLGAAVRIGEDVGKTRRNTALIDEMLDPGRYLGQNIDQMAVTPVNRAEGSPLAVAQNEGRLMDALTGNSTTAAQAQAMADLKGVPGIATPLTDLAQTGTLQLMARAVGKVLGSETGLDEAGLRSLAQVMMQSGPEGQAILQKILKRSPLTKVEQAFIAQMAAGRAGRAAAGAAGGSETQPAARLMEEVPSIMDIMGN
jgi:hypothetical protein